MRSPRVWCESGDNDVTFDTALSLGQSELIELIANGDLSRARARASELLEHYPQQAELWRLSAICALQQREFSAAQEALDRALELAPRSVESWCNLASLHTARNQFDDAERALRRALAIEPNHAAALNNLGSLLDARGDYHAAAECFAKAIVQRPDYARAWLNQAGALLTIRQLDRAESSARRAIQLAAQWPDAHFVLGNVLMESGRAGLAAAAYRDAVRLAPTDARYPYQLALAFDDQGDYAAAIGAYEQTLRLRPDFWPALSQLVYLKRRLCDWHGLAPWSKQLLDGVDRGADGITPFSFLVEESTGAQQLACTRRFAELKQEQIAPLQQRLGLRPRTRADGPIRVGFVSSGFREHPTALLVVELIERLRDSSLRTVGFATTPADTGALRPRLQNAFHEFFDLSGKSLETMLHELRARHVDILIDLDGYCEGSHPDLFALRSAPLQINWLAYPGTLGAPWYDYLLADRFVVPEEQRAFYSEKIACLPCCYQPSDTTRAIANPLPREQHGLPASGVVFTSFNASWKFTLRSFARWMKILAQAPDSVLWLLAGPINADEHLRRAAQAAGVDPQRLIFAPRVAHAEHLARYRLVDLFLDTNPYNAHTTASDALWAGCPVLSQPGATFASRVAGSLNHHLELPEMNVASDQAYIEKAVQLARDPAALAAVRRRVESAKAGSGLFDMGAYSRAFASALTAMFHQHKNGHAPQDFQVPPA
jgi:predicted O-linked N-acetylglucosamine transferase (SPINDLY family)